MRAFCEDWRFPSSVRGPVLSWALAAFAIWLAVDMSSGPFVDSSSRAIVAGGSAG